jgi:hypothetical protein
MLPPRSTPTHKLTISRRYNNSPVFAMFIRARHWYLRCCDESIPHSLYFVKKHIWNITMLPTLLRCVAVNFGLCQSQSQSYVTTDGQSASLSWNKAPIWGLRTDIYYCQTVAGLLVWGALSEERTGLSFTITTVWRRLMPGDCDVGSCPFLPMRAHSSHPLFPFSSSSQSRLSGTL